MNSMQKINCWNNLKIKTKILIATKKNYKNNWYY